LSKTLIQSKKFSQLSHVCVGNVLLISIPPAIFSNVIAASSVSVSQSSDRKLSPEEVALTNHIDNFLEVLLLFEDSHKEKDRFVEKEKSRYARAYI
jgi:hypothetical protein